MKYNKRKVTALRMRQIRYMLCANHTNNMQDSKSKPCGDVINIVMAMLTFFSVLGVFFTILEMRRDRDAAYRPTIVMNPIEIHFSWDSEDKEKGISFQDGIANGNTYEYSVVNIGVGTAKNIVFEWDTNNTSNLLNYLQIHHAGNSNFCVIGDDYDAFSYNDDNHIVISKEKPIVLMYMLPEAGEVHHISLPYQYILLIQEIAKMKQFDNSSPPSICLYVKYEDIQGKVMNDIYFITIKRMLYSENLNGDKEAICQLVPQIV